MAKIRTLIVTAAEKFISVHTAGDTTRVRFDDSSRILGRDGGIESYESAHAKVSMPLKL